jgi:phage shock protein E
MKYLLLIPIFILVGLSLGSRAVQFANTSAHLDAVEIEKAISAQDSGQFRDISPKELEDMLAKEDIFLVNVHVPYEGDIPGTDASIHFDQIKQRLLEFPKAKDAQIVVYCRSGKMSEIAAIELALAGYVNVYNLEDGFDAWTEAGYQLTP